MKYKLYSFVVVTLSFIAVAVIYFIFGNSQPPEQKTVEILEVLEDSIKENIIELKDLPNILIK